MLPRCFVASLGGLLLLAPFPQDPEPRTFLLKTRQTVTGRVASVEGDRVVLDVVFLDGSATIRRRLADFTPGSEFEIRMLAAPPGTFDEHLDMARTAIRLGLADEAGKAAGLARTRAKDDASGRETKTLDVWAAATLRTLFDSAIVEGNVVDARHYLRIMATLVASEFSEDDLGKMFDSLANAEQQSRLPVPPVGLAKDAAQRRVVFDAALAAVVVRVKKADEVVKEGLRSSRTTVKAARHYEQAIALYKSAAQELQAALKKVANDPEAQEEAAPLVQHMKDNAVQAALHAGAAMTMQGDYRSALEWANRGLAIDPANAEAKSLIRTILIAQSAGSGWGSWNR